MPVSLQEEVGIDAFWATTLCSTKTPWQESTTILFLVLIIVVIHLLVLTWMGLKGVRPKFAIDRVGSAVSARPGAEEQRIS